MSYDFHIARPDGTPIQREEWDALVASEGLEWKLELELTVTNPVTKAVIKSRSPEGAPLAIWLGNLEEFPQGVAFRFLRGSVTVSGHAIESTDSDDPTFAKMLALAQKLGAHVVGDEGEVY